MGFLRQFDQFDPKIDSVPHHPFSLLPNIVSRARSVLGDRNSDEILTAAQLADWIIEVYFEKAKDSFVHDQLQGGGWALQYLAPEDRNETGLRKLINAGLPDTADPDHYFGFDSPENLPEIEALKAEVDAHIFDDPGLPKPKPAELFAAMALWLVIDSLDWLKPKLHTSISNGIDVGPLRGILGDEKIHMSLAGESAIKAMEAVAFAEHLRALERIGTERDELKKDLQQQKQNIETLAELKAAQHRTAAAREAASVRHRENTLLKKYAIQYFEEHESEFKSAEDAAAAIAGKIVNVKHRTVAGWIRDQKKLRSAGKP